MRQNILQMADNEVNKENSGDLSHIPAASKARYRAKISICGGIDPYSLKPKDFVDAAPEIMPRVDYGDIYNFLVVETSFYTGRQMKSYKGLESFNYLVSGWVADVKQKSLDGDKKLLLAKVNHSQRLRSSPLKPWVICENEGAVLAAHCTCMAGLAESCSHIGALLFYVEYGQKMANTSSTSQLCRWSMPTAVKNVPYAEVRDIDFRSAGKKKKDFNEGRTPSPLRERNGQNALVHHRPSELEKQTLLKEIFAVAPSAAILTVSKDFYHHFKPKHVEVPPYLPAQLYCPDRTFADFSELLDECKQDLGLIKVTSAMRRNVERKTRQQSRCSEWTKFRAGRVTASNIKAACVTNVDQPSLSLLKKICYPKLTQFSSNATRWGNTHEQVALNSYQKMMRRHHSNVIVESCGFFIAQEMPFMGASPDGRIQCDCCGNGVIEVKCPYSLREKDLHSISKDELPADFVLKHEGGELSIDKKHSYYYQIQTQIFVTGTDFCDFVIWTPKSLIRFRVEPDHRMWTEIVEKVKNFYIRAVLPELKARWFTQPKSVPGPETYCSCKRGEEYGDMIACDGPNCPIEWFHMKCIQMRTPPEGDWFCSCCRKT